MERTMMGRTVTITYANEWSREKLLDEFATDICEAIHRKRQERGEE